MSFYRDQLEDYLKTLDIKAERVLDWGGKEKPIKGRTKSWDVNDYRILDLPECNLQGYGGSDELGDIIFCLEVMEYIWCPTTAILKLNHQLKDNGILYITFPFVYPHHNPAGTDMLRYTEWGARKLLENAGLQIEEIIYRVDRSGLLKEFYAADGMRASKEYAHHDATGFIFKCRKI